MTDVEARGRLPSTSGRYIQWNKVGDHPAVIQSSIDHGKRCGLCAAMMEDHGTRPGWHGAAPPSFLICPGTMVWFEP